MELKTQKNIPPGVMDERWAKTDYDSSTEDEALWVNVSDWLTIEQVKILTNHLTRWLRYFERKEVK